MYTTRVGPRTACVPSTSRAACHAVSSNKATRRVAAGAGQVVGPVSGINEKWQRLALVRRQLRVAVTEEQFKLAAELRDHIAVLREELSPVQQLLFHKLQQLDYGSFAEQQSALKSIGEVGGMDILGEVAEYLKAPQLDKAAAMALYEIWHRHPSSDPAIDELMSQGCKLMMNTRGLPQAEKIFSQIIHLDPAFAEGWNKRATCRFHLGSFQDSIHDCEITIGLNSYHFGAMVGQGFCHMKLREYKPAASSFQKALLVHPGLDEVRRWVDILKEGAERQEMD